MDQRLPSVDTGHSLQRDAEKLTIGAVDEFLISGGISHPHDDRGAVGDTAETFLAHPQRCLRLLLAGKVPNESHPPSLPLQGNPFSLKLYGEGGPVFSQAN